ncbi:MAG: hypothetical protein LBD28_08090 [Tannerellaceae bacterium]|jgi:hypothetical protein|nr:hypothetical protein [Tannerellaceae bacterium]
MKRSIQVCSLLISILILAGCGSHTMMGPRTYPHLDRTPRYRIEINSEKGGFSGALIIRKEARSGWRGSLVNEFGVKAFDIISPDRYTCKLQNVMPFISKWYIRSTITDDFRYLLWDGNEGVRRSGKQIDKLPNGTIVLTNTRRHIEYILHPLPNHDRR